MANLLVIGSMNMDIVTRVRELPVPGETIHGSYTAYHHGGKGANQAYAASRSGAQVTLAGGLGSDAFGAEILSKLNDEGIDTSYIARKPEASGVAFITIDSAGENSIILSPGANYGYSEEDLSALDLSSYDAVLLQNEIPGAVNSKVLELAKAAGCPVCLNPAPVSGFSLTQLRGIELLIVNEIEAGTLSGIPVQDFKQALQAGRILADEGIPQVIITLGSKGSLYVGRDGVAIQTPAFPVEAVDSTAAGDTFIGAFAAAYFAGRELRNSLRFASAAAALAVSASGAVSSIPLEKEITAFIQRVSL